MKSPHIQHISEKETPGLHNVLRLAPRIYSGNEPHGEEGFRSLAKHGIKYIVSVDGAIPNLKLAKKYGLKYIHIPIGYDGVPAKAARSFARIARDINEPIYIHCHHGKHRGPAAAAMICIAAGETSHQGALEILKTAGTSKDYAGLWRDVEKYILPKPGEKLPELVEVAMVDSLAAAMAKMDRHYDNLKLCQESGWKTPKNHPDLVPVQESLLLREGLRESARHLDEKFSREFRLWLTESENLAKSVEVALRKSQTQLATRRFKSLMQSCQRCHQKYRN